MAIVETRRLTKNYRRGGPAAVNDVSLRSEEGEFLVFLGPSGSGKSTLLRLIAGLEQPTQGDVLIGDRVVTGLTPRERRIAMVFQSYALYPHLTVEKNIAFPLKAQKVPRDQHRAKIEWAANLLGIGHLLARRPRELSGGERQRVAVARALVTRPAMLLADEPTGNLDSRTGQEILDLFDRLHAAGNTILLVTHDPEVGRRAARIVRVRDGKIESDVRNR
jgi:multiple sugar transport system ATP-binding protein